MKTFKIRFYLTTGGDLTVHVQAKSDYEARKIVQAQYAGSFKGFASSSEV
jgi:hypothetical protein